MPIISLVPRSSFSSSFSYAYFAHMITTPNNIRIPAPIPTQSHPLTPPLTIGFRPPSAFTTIIGV